MKRGFSQNETRRDNQHFSLSHTLVDEGEIPRSLCYALDAKTAPVSLPPPAPVVELYQLVSVCLPISAFCFQDICFSP